MEENPPDFGVILETLSRHGVDFIVVGGVCAVLLGAPVTTFDLDIVHARNGKNLDRLENALEELEAHYREHLPGQLRPKVNDLDSSGHHLLITKFGPLDVLGSIGNGDDYLTLDNHIENINLDDNTVIKILNLDTLIAVKTKTARAKDNAMLDILHALKQGSN